MKRFKDFINERSDIPKKEEFLQWVTEFKKKYSNLADWDMLMEIVNNDEDSTNEELKEYLMSNVTDTPEEVVDELIEHITGFRIFMTLYLGSEYDVEPEIFDPSGKAGSPDTLINVVDRGYESKTFEKFVEMKDSEIITYAQELGQRLKNIVGSSEVSPLVRNEGVNGITITFYIRGKKEKLMLFNYKYNDLGLCVIDINHKEKKYFANDTYGYEYPKIPVDTLKDEDFVKYLYPDKYSSIKSEGRPNRYGIKDDERVQPSVDSHGNSNLDND